MNPITVEETFHDLKSTLVSPLPPIQKFGSLGAFLRLLAGDYTLYQSYLLEIGDVLPRALHGFTCAGTDPRSAAVMVEEIHAAFHALPGFTSLQGCEEVLLQARQQTALLFASLGEIISATALLHEENSPPWLRDIQASNRLAPHARLVLARNEARTRKDPLIGSLELLVGLWKASDNGRRDTVTIPVVARPFRDLQHVYLSGALREISIAVFATPGLSRDEVRAAVAVYGTDAGEIVDVPLAGARSLIAETVAHSVPFVSGHLAFEGSNELHEGVSSGLAIASILYCAILKASGQRTQYRLKPLCAFTGCLDSSGTVRPVDDTTLERKVEAVFFSLTTVLVLPAQQMNVARACVERLRTVYPRRELTIIGLDHLRDVFFDRRLSERVSLSATRYALSYLWRKRHMASLGIVVLLLAVIARMMYGPIDRNAVAADFDATHILVQNREGETIEKIEAGPRTVASFVSHEPGDPNQSSVVFADVNGDGSNEVIWTQQQESSTEEFTTIVCRSIDPGKTVWSVPLKRSLLFPNSTDASGSGYYTNFILADDVDADGVPDLFTVAGLHESFPQLLLRLESQTGRIVGEYLHIGGLHVVKAVDLDRDGIKELITFGINNAYRSGCLAVLDPRYMSGHSPLTREYAVAEYPPGLERAYLRFPRSIVSTSFPTMAKYNNVSDVAIQEEDRLLRANVIEFTIHDPHGGVALAGIMFWQLGFDLAVRDIGSSDGFDVLYDHLVTQGNIPDVPRAQYLRGLKSGLRYWNGDTWQDTPCLNRRFVEAVENSDLR